MRVFSSDGVELMKSLVFAVCLLLSVPTIGHATQDDPGVSETDIDFETARLSRNVTAVRISEEIVLDGLLDEPVWDLADPATDFIQRTPRNGEPAGDRTEARFLYDDENLYVGVLAFDSNAENMVMTLVEDFSFSQFDVITVVLDTLNDDRSAFNFQANPGGARRDGQIKNDAQSVNFDWDGLWYLET
ncbi:MAG: carbohydrate binding family 9 domain-containing protein, partial [Gemmatimonadota bacterium]